MTVQKGMKQFDCKYLGKIVTTTEWDGLIIQNILRGILKILIPVSVIYLSAENNIFKRVIRFFI